MLRSAYPALFLAFSLAACGANENGGASGPSPSPNEAPEAATASSTDLAVADPDSECGAGDLGRWLNALPTDDVKTEIADIVGDRPIRYYGVNDAVTMDFHAERLNVVLGEDGRIKRFHCG